LTYDLVARNLAMHYARMWRSTQSLLAGYGLTHPTLVTFAHANPHPGIDRYAAVRPVMDARSLVKFHNQLLIEGVLVPNRNVFVGVNPYAYSSDLSEMDQIASGLSFLAGAVLVHGYPLWITETGPTRALGETFDYFGSFYARVISPLGADVQNAFAYNTLSCSVAGCQPGHPGYDDWGLLDTTGAFRCDAAWYAPVRYPGALRDFAGQGGSR
jgi:hypothetical protein